MLGSKVPTVLDTEKYSRDFTEVLVSRLGVRTWGFREATQKVAVLWELVHIPEHLLFSCLSP